MEKTRENYLEKSERGCFNCQLNNLCGCPVIDYDIVGKVSLCSYWYISLKAYCEIFQKTGVAFDE